MNIFITLLIKYIMSQFNLQDKKQTQNEIRDLKFQEKNNH